jgi:hypothetical protein
MLVVEESVQRLRDPWREVVVEQQFQAASCF